MDNLQMNRVENARVECDDFYRGMLKHVANGVYSVDTERRIIFWNKAAERLTGYCAKDVCGHRCSDNILRHVTENGQCLCTENCPLAATLRDGMVRDAYIFLHHHDGYRVPVQVSIRAQRDAGGEIIGAVETFSGNGVYMKTLEQMQQSERAEFTDALTGLANRTFMDSALDARIAEMHRTGLSFGVILAEADGYGDFCTTYGKPAGERMLRILAQTFLLNICNSDVVGRWEGQRFLVIVPHAEKDEIERLANRLCALSAQSWLTLDEENQASVTVSIGVAMSQPDEEKSALLHHTERLLALSKSAGGNRVSVESEPD